MKVRSYRISDDFETKLKLIQESNKTNGLEKTQKQIFDEMADLYIMHYIDRHNVLISDETETVLNNILQLYIRKQAEMQNALLDHIDQQIENLKEVIQHKPHY